MKYFCKDLKDYKLISFVFFCNISCISILYCMKGEGALSCFVFNCYYWKYSSKFSSKLTTEVLWMLFLVSTSNSSASTC